MFRTLQSNSTIYLSTWLPCVGVRVHIEVSCPLTVGVGGMNEGMNTLQSKNVQLNFNFITWFAPVFMNVARILV